MRRAIDQIRQNSGGNVAAQVALLIALAVAGVSLCVVLAGGLIRLTGRAWVDPAVSLLIAAVILLSTWKLLAASVNLALDAVPCSRELAHALRTTDTSASRFAITPLREDTP